MVKASTLATLTKLAKAATKGGTDLTALIEAASVAVAAANALLKEAKPILDNVDTEAVAEMAKATMQTAAQGAGKAGKAAKGAAKGAADSAADTVSGIFTKLGEAKDGIFEDLAKTKGEKELKNAIKTARQTVLENATTTITVSDLAKAKEKAGESAIGPISDMPGCFVIATYKKMDFDKDLTDYIGIYVGRADNAAVGVDLAMSRDGDADVYADVKYKQNVHIYVFNCMPADLDERYLALMQTFTDERLYA